MIIPVPPNAPTNHPIVVPSYLSMEVPLSIPLMIRHQPTFHNTAYYGLKQSPRMFWKYLTAAMVKSGMQVSKLDPCLFVDDRVVCICYVDDILFWSKDEKYMNELAEMLRAQGLLLEQ